LQSDITVGIGVEKGESFPDVSFLLLGELLAELTASLLADGSTADSRMLGRQRLNLSCSILLSLGLK
jgi:hypothetical protein